MTARSISRMNQNPALRWVMLSLLCLASLMAALQAPPARADTGGIEEMTRSVIEGQLEAFKNDDSEKAFSFATRNIQVMFQEAARFMEMVKTDYNVVYRPSAVKFLKFAASEEQAMHTVQMVDQNNTLWNVYYRLQNTGKEGWKISSCEISRAQAQLI